MIRQQRTLRIVGVVDAATRAAVGGFRALARLRRPDPEDAQLLAIEILAAAAASRNGGLENFMRAYGPLFNRVAEQLYRHRDDPVLAQWARQMRDAGRLLEGEKLAKVRQRRKRS